MNQPRPPRGGHPQERARRVIDAASVGFAVLDRDGKVRWTNPALLRLTGLTRGRVLGQPLGDLVVDDTGDRLDFWQEDPHRACAVDLTFEAASGERARLTGWINPLAPGEGDPDDHATVQLVPRDVSTDLAHAAARFDAVAPHLSDAVIVTDADLVIRNINPPAAATFPSLREGDLLSAALDPAQRETFTAAARVGVGRGVTFTLPSPEGDYDTTVRELRDAVGQLVGFALVAHPSSTPTAPIPGKDPGPEAMALGSAAAILAATDDVVWILDVDGPIAASAGARALLGLAADADLANVSLSAILAPDSRRRLVQDGLAPLVKGGEWEAELELLDATGAHHESRVRLRHHEGSADTWSITATVIENRSAAIDAVLRDGSTGLPTETVLHDRLQLSIERSGRNGRRTCLVAIAIDGYDELPDAIGDELAAQVADAVAGVLHTQVRPGDTLARTGVARFEVVRDDVTDIRDGERFADRLRASVDDPITVDGVRWFVSVSAGVALTQPGVTSVAGLRRNGHTALEAAQGAGGAHTVVFGGALRSERTGPRVAPSRPRSSRPTTHHDGPRPTSPGEPPTQRNQ